MTPSSLLLPDEVHAWRRIVRHLMHTGQWRPEYQRASELCARFVAAYGRDPGCADAERCRQRARRWLVELHCLHPRRENFTVPDRYGRDVELMDFYRPAPDEAA
jgi:hypothetical protein